MTNDKVRDSRESPFDGPLLNYPHIAMMSSIPCDPWEIFGAINESASSPTLSDVDRQIERLCRDYDTACEERRAKLRRIVTNGWSLLHYAHRMAVRAMRTNDANCIRLGFTSLLLDNARSDVRDTITRFVMLHHAASRIKSSFPALASEAIEKASPTMAEGIQQFLTRDPESVSLQAFWLRESHDANGPRIDVGIEKKI